MKAKEEGKVRHLGFSAHSEEAAVAALEKFDFDSVLFPLGFPSWIKGKFGPAIHQKVRESGA